MIGKELLLIILAESGLSLYPLLIKMVDTNLITQLAIRFISYSVLSCMGSFIFDSSIISYNGLLEYIYLGIINILHVITSYSAFEILSSGAGYTLFYLYPIFNLISRNLIYKEFLDWKHYLYIILAIAGVYFLTKNQSNAKYLVENTQDYNYYLGLGVGSGLLSAITESVMYLLIKGHPKLSAYQQITSFYLLGGIISLMLVIKSYLSNQEYFANYESKGNKDNKIQINKTSFFGTFEIQYSWQQMLELVLFNSLIGFIGYTIIYYTIPRTTTIQFNTLVFTGIIFSYIWGYVLNSERIQWQNALGSFLIIISIVMANKSS